MTFHLQILMNAQFGQALEGSWIVMWNDGQEVRELNDRLMMAERAFTDSEGLKGRSWYKHLVGFTLKPANSSVMHLRFFASD